MTALKKEFRGSIPPSSHIVSKGQIFGLVEGSGEFKMSYFNFTILIN